MSFIVVSNGVGRKPHIEELDNQEDVIARLETDRESFVVIEGKIIDYHEERLLILEDCVTVLQPGGGEDAGTIIPRWSAPTTGEAEHIPDVGEHPEGAKDDSLSDRTGNGSEYAGAGEAVNGSDGVDGESQRGDSVVPPEEQTPEG